MIARRLALGAMVLGMSQPAFAWRHLYEAWLPDDMPLQYHVSEQCEDSVPEDYCNPMIADSYQAWADVPCVDLEFEYAGIYDGGRTHDNNDPRNHFEFNDPSNTQEVGVLASALNLSFGVAFQLDGALYAHIDNADICFNDNVDFTTQEDAMAGNCNGETNMRSTAVHEIGHTLGLGHSCEEGEPCADQDLRGAVMFWSSDSCETLVDVQADDIQAITPLYGPSASFACSHEASEDLVIGVVPFTMECTVASRDFLPDVTGATWIFGDGGTAEGTLASHEYTEPGNYTVEVTVSGDSEGCDDEGWTTKFRKVGYVRACGIPDAEFTIDHVDGLQYRMMNETDVSVYGCIQDIVWEVYEGDKVQGEPIANLAAKAWEPVIDFPEEGTYTIVLNVGGAAGTGAASLTVDILKRRGAGRGCSTAGGAGAGLFVLLGLGVLGLRRRD